MKKLDEIRDRVFIINNTYQVCQAIIKNNHLVLDSTGNPQKRDGMTMVTELNPGLPTIYNGSFSVEGIYSFETVDSFLLTRARNNLLSYYIEPEIVVNEEVATPLEKFVAIPDVIEFKELDAHFNDKFKTRIFYEASVQIIFFK